MIATINGRLTPISYPRDPIKHRSNVDLGIREGLYENEADPLNPTWNETYGKPATVVEAATITQSNLL